MLDLLRTRTATDPETAGCAKLIAAIIADSIRSASSKPNSVEQSKRINMNTRFYDAAKSLWFLFDHASMFTAYAHMIGLDAREIRKHLLDPDRKYRPKAEFDDVAARNLRIRYGWYLEHKQRDPYYHLDMLKVVDRAPQVPKEKPRKNKKHPNAIGSVWRFADKFAATDLATENKNGI